MSKFFHEPFMAQVGGDYLPFQFTNLSQIDTGNSYIIADANGGTVGVADAQGTNNDGLFDDFAVTASSPINDQVSASITDVVANHPSAVAYPLHTATYGGNVSYSNQKFNACGDKCGDKPLLTLSKTQVFLRLLQQSPGDVKNSVGAGNFQFQRVGNARDVLGLNVSAGVRNTDETFFAPDGTNDALIGVSGPFLAATIGYSPKASGSQMSFSTALYRFSNALGDIAVSSNYQGTLPVQ